MTTSLLPDHFEIDNDSRHHNTEHHTNESDAKKDIDVVRRAKALFYLFHF